jgi:3-hydroxyisobutyrate dehydrogenase-like beta-hydroxyacid dehydrogenase
VKQVIGVAGMGTMGMPMAASMVRNGLQVVVYNRTVAKTHQLQELGAQVAVTPRELCDKVDILILMLAGPQAIDDVLFTVPATVSLLRGKIVVNMGTVSPSYSKSLATRLAQSGVDYVEGPVFGSRKPAEQGSLVVLSAGPVELLNTLQPVFDAVGKKTVRCGEVPAGMVTKIATNLLIGAHIEALAEALNFVQKSGADPSTYMEVVLAGPLASDFYRMKAPKFLQRDFSPQASNLRVAETFDYIIETASQTGAAVPVASVNHQLYQAAIDAGFGDEDMCAIMKVLEARSRPVAPAQR